MKSGMVAFGIVLIPTLLVAAEPNFTIHYPVSSNTSHDIVYLFAHGLGATQHQAQALMPKDNNYWILQEPLAGFDFPDSRPTHMDYDPKLVNLGQTLDMERLLFAYNRTRAEFPNHKIVLGGISRGAVAALNTAALNPEEFAANVSCIIADSPFDSFNNVVKHLLKRFHIGWIPFSRKLAIRYVKKTFPQFDINGIFPINIVHFIPLDMPIMIVCVESDKTIPSKSYCMLYTLLAQTGHQHVYLLKLAAGNHGKLIMGPEGEVYQNAIHAFYKRYNLPHEEQFAKKGEPILRFCQPNLQDMKKYVKKLKRLQKKNKRTLLLEDSPCLASN